MTVEQWKVRFAKWQHMHQRKWYLSGSSRCIRTTDHLESCPITAGYARSATAWWIVGEVIGLTTRAQLAILCAADGREGHSPRLRRWLLKTCGVKEATA